VSETAGDIQMCIDVFEYMAELAPKMLKPSPIALPDGDFRSSIVPAAAGVVGAITPWNYPLMQAAAKVAPALAAGCSVLLKPSPLASLTCLKLGEIGRENGLPEGALTVITGGPPDGKEGGADCLTNHPRLERRTALGPFLEPSRNLLGSVADRLDLLSFTGSSAAGSALLHCSANKLRRSSLELGGKGALLVFEDASIDAAVDWAMVGIFSAAGQVISPHISPYLPISHREQRRGVLEVISPHRPQPRRHTAPSHGSVAQTREIWGDVGRCGEIWGDTALSHGHAAGDQSVSQ